MKLARTDWNEYVKALVEINKRAANEMEEFIANYGIGNRNLLIDKAYQLIEKYGAGSSSAACRMFELLANLTGNRDIIAEPAEISSKDEVAEAVNGSLLQSTTGKKVSGVVSRFVKQASADTMLQNARRYGAEFAWVPSGDSCPFCFLLASGGWRKAGSKTISGDHATHIHAHCRCQYAVRFDGKMSIEGYDPKAMEDYYKSMPGSDSKERLNALRRELYSRSHGKDITDDFMANATPGVGNITQDVNYNVEQHSNEIRVADWMKVTFGGKIRLLAEREKEGIKWPDYEWNGRLWDLKQISSEKAPDSAIRGGLKQIRTNPGGFIFECDNNLDLEKVRETIAKRMNRNMKEYKEGVVVIIKRGNRKPKIYLYKK